MMTAFLDDSPTLICFVDLIPNEARGVSYQVMTLSAIGDADTPAGGSICIRCTSILVCVTLSSQRRNVISAGNRVVHSI